MSYLRSIKMLGLAAVAAVAAMALVGASSASATTLCKVNESTCAEANQFSAPLALKGSSAKAELKTNIDTVICTSSVVKGEIKSTVTTVSGLITSLNFTSCKDSFGTTCTVGEKEGLAKSLPYSATVTATSAGNGTMSVVSDGTGNPGALVKCGTLINCTFTTEKAELAVTGGNPATATANGIALKREGGACPETSTWTATYKLEEPTGPVFVEPSP